LDSVNAESGEVETIGCGAGNEDSAPVDKRDTVKGCEKVKRAKKSAVEIPQRRRRIERSGRRRGGRY
jgi:hypothetical protein